MTTITLIIRNFQPIAYANSITEAKKMIMNRLEKHPEYYKNVEDWWENTSWNVKNIYSFKEITNILNN